LSIKYLVTTTHRSNPRVRSLAKELALSLPRAVKVNRGKMSLLDVVANAKALGAQRVLIVGRGLMGNPGRIEIMERLDPPYISLVLKLSGVKLARELGVRPRPPRAIVLTTQPSNEASEFAHELSVALNIPMVEGVGVSGPSSIYDASLFIEYVGKPRALFALRFLDSSTGMPRGPRLLVEKYAVVKRASL